MEATVAMKLKQLQAMIAHDALVAPEFQQREERRKLEGEIVNTFEQARAALNHLLYANHKPCLGCDGCNNARKVASTMEAPQ